MLEKDLQIILDKLKLGTIDGNVTRIYGGLLHKMYRVDTTTGSYAIKALNPIIMLRPGVPEHYYLSEKLCKIAQKQGIPVASAYEDDTCLLQTDGRFYMVFDWVDAENIAIGNITKIHCRKIGGLLADLHDIQIDERINDVSQYSSKSPWESYLEYDSPIKQELTSMLVDIYLYEEKANDGADIMRIGNVISHNDIDCKNVLWDKQDNPILIDWESAGYGNVSLALVDVICDWSGIDTLEFSVGNLETLIGAYTDHGGCIDSDVLKAVYYRNRSKLGWLEYNIKRAIGIESNDDAEVDMGVKQVIQTLSELKIYNKNIPALKEILGRYV